MNLAASLGLEDGTVLDECVHAKLYEKDGDRYLISNARSNPGCGEAK